jgi:hypothetical protein
VITVEVYRGKGDTLGAPIIEPILSDQEALIERGRVEMNAHAHMKTTVTLSVVPTPGIRLGQLIEVFSASHGERFRGKVIGIEHSASASEDGAFAETSITIERPIS